jgi:uncharacterized membrane protein HdeD (DUF308 family)
MKPTERMAGQRPTPPRWVSEYWWAISASGLVLLTIGIIIHARPTERGEPVSLGVLLIVAGLGGLRIKRRQKP